jgi:hypothetical protein
MAGLSARAHQKNLPQKDNMKTRIQSACMGAAMILAPTFAVASLGDSVDSVHADQARMRAAPRAGSTAPASTTSTGYTLHEMQTPAGTTIREYVSPEGKVFAVTWQGPAQPDVRQLLGRYFDQYKEASAQRRGSHRHASVQRSGLVVESSGHLRAFTGKAYVPQMLPQGVSPEDLK